MERKEIKDIFRKNQQTRYKITPDVNKCFQSKKTGHKFIHSITGKGLPLFVTESEIALYDEVDLCKKEGE